MRPQATLDHHLLVARLRLPMHPTRHDDTIRPAVSIKVNLDDIASLDVFEPCIVGLLISVVKRVAYRVCRLPSALGSRAVIESIVGDVSQVNVALKFASMIH